MSRFSGKRWWLVGASEGLGRALAHKLSDAGATVILSARSEDRLRDLADELSGPAEVVTVDVSDMESCKRAAEAAGKVDGVVWLAGVYWPQSARDWNPEQVEAMFDINLTGAARILGHVVPNMVERGSGHIVLTSSLTGFRGLPKSIGYTASKAGVMSLAECLYADLRGSGVRAQVANPGFIRTRLTDKNDFNMPQIMTPEEAADHMMTLMRSDAFKKSFPAPFAWLFRGSQFLPDWLYYRVFG